jgi:hypothetical protein
MKGTTVVVLVVSFFLLAVSTASVVSARTWYVNPQGTGDAPTIEAALDSAVYWDTVLVACGTYTGDRIFMGPGIVFRSETGRPDCVTINQSSILVCVADSVTRIEGITMSGARSGSLRIRGPGVVENCSISGSNENTNLSSRGGGVTAENATFINCGISGYNELHGGGAYATNTTFINCSISGQAYGDGGGMVGSGVTLIRCSVTGGADTRGGGFKGSTTLIDSCTMGGTAWFGGGAMAGSATTMTNTVFRNSSTKYDCGGAIYGGAGYMADCTFIDNSTYSTQYTGVADGGAIEGGASVMERCVFTGNHSPWGKGGAINGGVGIMRDCVFDGNAADYGGAFYSWGQSSITRCYFKGNHGYVENGAIYARSDASITRSTFYGNVAAGKGGSVTAASDVTISQSIISFGTSAAVPVYCDNGGTVTIECSNVYGNSGGDYVGCIAGQLGLNGNISADPMFVNAAGGDFSLLPGSPCLPENNGCGLMGAGSIACGDYFAVNCPADQVLPAFSTIEFIVLDNFWIRNDYCEPRDFAWTVWTEGPAALVDNGDPMSLSGTTPLLNPGEVFTPPDAALEVPAIRHDTDQLVWYRVEPLLNPAAAETCVTVIDVAAPVPVWISGVAARAVGTGVDLRWKAASDQPIAGYHIYRSEDGRQEMVPLNNGQLLPPGTGAFLDSDVLPGQTYRYIVGVVAEDGSETRSREVSVKARPLELALEQNHPNPFNPVTTIPFIVPETGRVRLSVYDVKGSLVKTLYDGILPAGFRQLTWEGTDNRGNGVGSGVYFCRLVFGNKSLTKRMTLLK